jgi:23S rRNA pseudouridine2605 synthase
MPEGDGAPDGDEDERGPRLQAFLARAGIASRRACERLILAGRVAVDGAVVSALGSRVPPGSAVTLDGAPVKPEARIRSIVLNKPPGYLSAMSDPEGRPLAVDLLKDSVRERVYNAGRLDQWSSGLLLFTNDGELASLLLHPSGGIDKEYEITADAPLTDAFFEGFRRGTLVDGVVYRALEAVRVGPSRARVILVEGKNREIRRVLEAFGRRALSLRRIRIGPVSIEGLAEGSFRDLSDSEVAALKSCKSRPAQRDAPRGEG